MELIVDRQCPMVISAGRSAMTRTVSWWRILQIRRAASTAGIVFPHPGSAARRNPRSWLAAASAIV